MLHTMVFLASLNPFFVFLVVHDVFNFSDTISDCEQWGSFQQKLESYLEDVKRLQTGI